MGCGGGTNRELGQGNVMSEEGGETFFFFSRPFLMNENIAGRYIIIHF